MNLQALTDWIEQVGIENIIWVTDIDETLVEKGANPNDILAPAGLEDDCFALDDLTEGRFFIVTGREMPYIDELFPSKGLKVSSEYHNLMRLHPGQPEEEVNPQPDWSLIDPDLQLITDAHPGMVLRIKPYMRSLHYSGAPDIQADPELKAAIHEELEMLLEGYQAQTGQEITIIDGGKVYDMGPGGLNKGYAYDAILDYVAERNTDGRKLYPIYFGDSPGDLPAAELVQQNGGKFISVGDDDRVTLIADFKLTDPEECRALVKAVIEKYGKDLSAQADLDQTSGTAPDASASGSVPKGPKAP